MRFVLYIGISIVMFMMSCYKDLPLESTESIFNKIVFTEGSREVLSDLSLKNGIYKLTAKKNGKRITYTSDVAVTTLLNGEEIDFSNYTFVLSENALQLEEYALSLIDNELYLETPLYSGYMKDGKDNGALDTKTAALIILYQEISTDSTDSQKMTYANFLKIAYPENIKDVDDPLRGVKAKMRFRNKQCELNHATEFGWSKESTEHSLQSQLRDTHFYNGCAKVGKISTSCFTDSHGCMSSQTYNCPCASE